MNDDSTSLSTARVSHDEISQRAQQLWESLGRPEGRDEEIWLQAERELQPAPAPSATSAPVLEEIPPMATPASSAPKPPAKTSAVPRKPSARSSKAAAR